MSTTNTFDLKSFNVKKFDKILSRGLCSGMGNQGSQVCIEAAICETLGLPHGDNPKCVAASVRAFKIRLNDSRWSSDRARAKGLRKLGLAQLGSLGVVDDREFATRLAKATIQQILPLVFALGTPEMKAAGLVCEKEGTEASARAAQKSATPAAAKAAAYAAAAAAAYAAVNAANAYAYAAAYAADATYAAAYAADAAKAAAYADADAAAYAAYAADAAYAAAYPAAYADAVDKVLRLSAKIALEILKDLKSPGCELL